ncbi:MAG: hypothetical protein GY859_29800 [Desulfobacterales bacterium]|nr:hypothetical protein [Desulfobacterales bacterium]
MLTRNNPSAASGRRALHVLIFIGLTLAFLVGCSPTATYDKAARGLSRSTKKMSAFTITGKKFNKKVGLAFVINDTRVALPDIEKTLLQDLVDVLNKECPKLILLRPDAPDCPSAIARPRSLPSGRFDNLALAEIGRKLGLNAIITVALIDIGKHQEDSGFLWFRNTDVYLQARLRAVVYDTETAAKVLDQSFMDQDKIEDWAERSGAELTVDRYPEMTDIIHNAAVLMGEDICDAFRGQNWKTYVSEIYNDGTIVISAGEASELKPDDVLAVYDNTELISGLKDQQFFLPGAMTARIKVTQVYPDRIEAILLEDMGIKAGDTVKQEP